MFWADPSANNLHFDSAFFSVALRNVERCFVEEVIQNLNQLIFSDTIGCCYSLLSHSTDEQLGFLYCHTNYWSISSRKCVGLNFRGQFERKQVKRKMRVKTCVILLVAVEIVASHVLNRSLTQNHRISKWIMSVDNRQNVCTRKNLIMYSSKDFYYSMVYYSMVFQFLYIRALYKICHANSINGCGVKELQLPEKYSKKLDVSSEGPASGS